MKMKNIVKHKYNLNITNSMAIEVKVKKWGNSLGIILPKELVNEKNIKINDKINVDIGVKADLSDIFKTLNFKMPGQKIKDIARKGWD